MPSSPSSTDAVRATLLASLLVTALLGATACGGATSDADGAGGEASSSGGAAGASSSGAAGAPSVAGDTLDEKRITGGFGAFCTGTLLREVGALPAAEPGIWKGTGLETAPAGTVFLLGYAGTPGVFTGYAYRHDNIPVLISPNPGDLVRDVDFTTDCVVGEKPFNPYPVTFLLRSTIYPDDGSTSTPCVVGEAVTLDLSVTFGSQLEGPGLKARCGFASGRSSDAIYAELIRK